MTSTNYFATVLLICCMLSSNGNSMAKDLERPCILVKLSEKKEILTKIETRDWARDIYTYFYRLNRSQLL